MKRCNFFLTEQQIEYLKRISDLTGLSSSEALRRALDYVRQPQTTFCLFPHLSGTILEK